MEVRTGEGKEGEQEKRNEPGGWKGKERGDEEERRKEMEWLNGKGKVGQKTRERGKERSAKI